MAARITEARPDPDIEHTGSGCATRYWTRQLVAHGRIDEAALGCPVAQASGLKRDETSPLRSDNDLA
jgi:hypothetical protein